MKDCLSVSFFLGNCRFGRERRSFAAEVEEETSLDHLSSQRGEGDVLPRSAGRADLDVRQAFQPDSGDWTLSRFPS